MQLCFATANKHKLEEVKKMISPAIDLVGLIDIGCNEEIPETSGTIPGNSKQKAEYIFQNYHVVCFADDSGLKVEALGGKPGVDSAIYAGPQRSHSDNINLLLSKLGHQTNRRAHFITVVTLINEDGVFQFEGILNGTIGFEKKGTGGFGYDPVFTPDGYFKTLAEMTIEEKNKISHRSIAIQKLVEFLKKY